MKAIIVVIMFLVGHCCIAQQIKYQSGIKVTISDFYKSPPDCGIYMNKSLYEAEVVDSLSILLGKKILVCVTCKTDNYKIVRSNRFILAISDDCQYIEGTFNFTNYTEEELKKKKIYNVLMLAELREPK